MIVWIASYPRSGNTFFRVLLNNIFGIKSYSIYDDRFDIGADNKMSEIVGHKFLPGDFELQKVREKEEVFYIKTHELLDDRIDADDKVIYLIRDGRDCSLSFVKHQQKALEKSQITLSNIIEGLSFVEGWDWGWGEHVESWQAKYRGNTLLIRFEELIKEPLLYVDDIAKFINKLPINNVVPTFEQLQSINPNFFRKGKINSWEEEYSEEEHLKFWSLNYKQMVEYNYTYLMPQKIDDSK